MRRIHFHSAPPSDAQGKANWLVNAVREIEMASQEETSDVADKFTVTNAPAGGVYTFDAATATLQDVRDVLATFLLDMKRRGATRGG